MAGEEAVIDIQTLAEELNKASDEGNVEEAWRIFRVPRSCDKDVEDNAAYEPKYISIGPFHHGKDSLQPMELLKRSYTKDLLKRSSESGGLNEYVGKVTKVEAQARKRYRGDINLEPPEFVKMLVIDACFIIEFLVSYYLHHKTPAATTATNPHVPNEPNNDATSASTPATNSPSQQAGSTSTTKSLSRDDLFLLLRSDILYRLENQIPFFILDALYSQLSDRIHEKIDRTKIRGLTDLALFYVHMGDEKSLPFHPIPNHHVYHLLHLFHASSCNQPSDAEKHKEQKTPGGEESEKPEREGKSQAGENSDEKQQEGDMAEDEENVEVTEALFFIFLFLLLLPIILVFFLLGLYRRQKHAAWLSDEEKSVASRMIPCATDLRNAGIKFEKRNADNLLDVKFDKKRTLEIPVFSITEETACRLRNLIALELYLPVKERYFTSYAALMMNLMETKEDVSILKSRDILKSKLGSDKHVPRFFIKLCKGGHFSYHEHCFVGLFQGLKDYHDRKYNFYKWRAKLIPDYFTNPWAIPSMIAASLFLILTVLQTFYTILSYY